jgi:hypothetical protein
MFTWATHDGCNDGIEYARAKSRKRFCYAKLVACSCGDSLRGKQIAVTLSLLLDPIVNTTDGSLCHHTRVPLMRPYDCPRELLGPCLLL